MEIKEIRSSVINVQKAWPKNSDVYKVLQGLLDSLLK